MRNLKLVPKRTKPTTDQLAALLKARARVIDGETWIPVRDLRAAVRLILGDGQ